MKHKSKYGSLRLEHLPEYGTWQTMIYRCHNPKCKQFKHYGARGIEVCNRWRFGKGNKPGFVCYFEDTGPRPEGLTLERKNNNKGYCKSNCYWATWHEQAINKRGCGKLIRQRTPDQRAAYKQQHGKLIRQRTRAKLIASWTPERRAKHGAASAIWMRGKTNNVTMNSFERRMNYHD